MRLADFWPVSRAEHDVLMGELVEMVKAENQATKDCVAAEKSADAFHGEMVEARVECEKAMVKARVLADAIRRMAKSGRVQAGRAETMLEHMGLEEKP